MVHSMCAPADRHYRSTLEQFHLRGDAAAARVRTIECTIARRLRHPQPTKAPLHGRVLLAEDNEINAIVAQASLAQLGLEVEHVANGLGVVERICQTRSPRPDWCCSIASAGDGTASKLRAASASTKCRTACRACR